VINTLSKSACTLLLFLLLAHDSNGQSILPIDTVRHDEASAPKASGKFNMINRFVTGSVFFFTGVVTGSSPTFDTKFSYINKGWGGSLFKSFDMIGKSPAMDYAIIVLYKNIGISKKLMISPQIGTQLNQGGSVADNTSDILANLAMVYKPTTHLTISNDFLFQNLVYTHKQNWTNRFKVMFQKSGFNIAGLIWDRNDLFGNPSYTTAGVDLSYSGIKINPATNLLMGFQSVTVLRNSTPRKSGFQFFIGAGI
jgi:hypothetical protein